MAYYSCPHSPPLSLQRFLHQTTLDLLPLLLEPVEAGVGEAEVRGVKL